MDLKTKSLVIYGLLLLELLVVTGIDIKIKKVSNYWSIFHLLVFAPLVFLLPELYSLRLEVFLIPLALFAIGFLLYLVNVMGAGDVKFLTTFLLIVPLSLQKEMLFSLALATVLIASIYMVIRIVSQRNSVLGFLKTRDWGYLKGLWGSNFAFMTAPLVGWLWMGITLRIWQ